MKRFFFQELVKPVVHRVGSAVGVYLAASDLFTQAQVDVLAQGSVILSGLVVDLFVRRVL
jgi:hypothetical protein